LRPLAGQDVGKAARSAAPAMITRLAGRMDRAGVVFSGVEVSAMLDADWREVARIVLRIDPGRDLAAGQDLLPVSVN